MNTLLSQEVCNRYLQLPLAERADILAAIMRITVEVTLELKQHSPESVDEFLRLCALQPRSIN